MSDTQQEAFFLSLCLYLVDHYYHLRFFHVILWLKMQQRSHNTVMLYNLSALPSPGSSPSATRGTAIARTHPPWCWKRPVCPRGSQSGTAPSSSAEERCSGSQWTEWPGNYKTTGNHGFRSAARRSRTRNVLPWWVDSMTKTRGLRLQPAHYCMFQPWLWTSGKCPICLLRFLGLNSDPVSERAEAPELLPSALRTNVDPPEPLEDVWTFSCLNEDVDERMQIQSPFRSVKVSCVLKASMNRGFKVKAELHYSSSQHNVHRHYSLLTAKPFHPSRLLCFI